MLRWLVDTFKLTNRLDLVHHGNFHALLAAAVCTNNGVEIVRWLVSNYQFSEDDIHTYCLAAFETACWSGILDTAELLLEKFKFTAAEYGAERFRLLCILGNVRGATWVHRVFGFTEQDLCNGRNDDAGSDDDDDDVDEKDYYYNDRRRGSGDDDDNDDYDSDDGGDDDDDDDYDDGGGGGDGGDHSDHHGDVLKLVCSHGDVRRAQWLFDTFHFTKEFAAQVCIPGMKFNLTTSRFYIT